MKIMKWSREAKSNSSDLFCRNVYVIQRVRPTTTGEHAGGATCRCTIQLNNFSLSNFVMITFTICHTTLSSDEK